MYESFYKLSDMYTHGYGTPVNRLAARNMIEFIYPENLRRFLRGDVGCKFADLALRKGGLCRYGVLDEDEYYYYTLADYAIRRRMEQSDYYGDSVVFANIQRELRRVRSDRPLLKGRTIRDEEPSLLYEALDGYTCKIGIRRTKQGLSIRAERLPDPKGGLERFFVCFPEHGYCRLEKDVTVTALGGEMEDWPEKSAATH